MVHGRYSLGAPRRWGPSPPGRPAARSTLPGGGWVARSGWIISRSPRHAPWPFRRQGNGPCHRALLEEVATEIRAPGAGGPAPRPRAVASRYRAFRFPPSYGAEDP